jgi:hypothetical protein
VAVAVLGAVRNWAASVDSIAGKGVAVDLFAEGTANEHVAAIPPLFAWRKPSVTGGIFLVPKYRVGCRK